MSWKPAKFKESLINLFSNSQPAPTDSVMEDSLDDVRHAMLATLGERGAQAYPTVTRKIRLARDIQSLWYLRSDLMASLSNMVGESAAHEKVTKVSDMFQGLLPESQGPRSSKPRS